MRTVDPIAPGAAKLEAAGGITVLRPHVTGTGSASGKCGLCGAWDDGNRVDVARWARRHARDAHDALRPSVLGLDLSLTRAGIAVSTLDPARDTFWPSLLTYCGETGSMDATWDERCDRLVRQVRAVIGYVDTARRAGADIRLAVVEGPSYGNSAMPSYYDRAGLQWSVYAALRSRGIPIAVVTPDHRAKFICGVKPPPGDKGKKLVLEQSRARWSTPRTPDVDPAKLIPNHDVADALGLCELGVLGAARNPLCAGWAVPWQVRRRHVENVHLVTWPAVTP